MQKASSKYKLKIQFSRLGNGFFWSGLSAVLTSGINFLTAVLIARILSKEGFGEYLVVQSTAMTIAGISQLAIGYTATKYISEYRIVSKHRVSRIIGACAITSAVLAFFASVCTVLSSDWIAKDLLGRPDLVFGLKISAFMIFFNIMNGYQLGVLAGLESFKILAKLNLVGMLTGSSLLVGLAYIYGINGLFIGLSVTSFLQWILTSLFLRAEFKIHQIKAIYKDCLKELPVFYGFALPAAISGFISMPVLWIGNVYLAKSLDGFNAVAGFAAANGFRTIVLFVPSILSRVSLSVLNNYKGERNYQGYRQVFALNLKISLVVSIFTSIAIGIFGIPLLGLYGGDFKSSYSTLLLLLAAGCIEATFQALYQHIQSNGKMWSSLFLIVLPRDLMLVMLIAYLVPNFGANGLATSLVISWALSLLILSFIVNKFDKLNLWK